MNCPVCKRKIEFNIPEEDIYYDCSHCQSSLLFSKGECQVIHKEQIDTLNSEQVKTESSQIDQTGKEEFDKGTDGSLFEDSFEKNTEYSLSEQEIKQTKTDPLEDNFDSKVNTETINQKTQKEELDSETQNKASELENKTEEENFFPEEDTKVPELLDDELEEPVKNPDPDELSYKFEEKEEEKPEKIDSINSQEEDISHSTDQKTEEDFSDVAEFAKNQEKNTKGLYLYDLTLSQINSHDLKEEVLAVLEDSFLNLSIEDNSFNLQDVANKGHIKIPKISPVQTYIIVHSLKGLPLDIQWEQYHIADE